MRGRQEARAEVHQHVLSRQAGERRIDEGSPSA